MIGIEYSSERANARLEKRATVQEKAVASAAKGTQSPDVAAKNQGASRDSSRIANMGKVKKEPDIRNRTNPGEQCFLMALEYYFFYKIGMINVTFQHLRVM